VFAVQVGLEGWFQKADTEKQQPVVLVGGHIRLRWDRQLEAREMPHRKARQNDT
jgi:hypothetical protein